MARKRLAAGISALIAACVFWSAAGAQIPLADPGAATLSWPCLTTERVRSTVFPAAPWQDGCAPISRLTLAQRSRFRAFALPAAPASLLAEVTGGTVRLTWQPPSNGDAPTSYVLEAGSRSGAADLAVSDTGTPATSLVATNVAAGTYFVRVKARNASGVGGASNEIVVTVGGGGCAQAPNAPTGLSVVVRESSVTLTWQAPASSCAPTAYTIEAGSASGLSNLASFTTGNTVTSFATTGVGAGTYFVRVRAVNGSGTSGASNEVQFTIGGSPCTGPPPAPTGLTGSVSGSTVSLEWNAVSGGAGYVLEAGSASGLSNLVVSDQGAATSLTATAGNGTYYVRVRAHNNCGTSAASNEIVVTVGGTTTHVSVDRADDVGGYQVKIMYVVPSNAADRQLDLTGALATSGEAWQRWLQQQSGGQRLRLDTFNGQPDIAFVRLSQTDAQIAASGIFVRDQVQAEINAMGFNNPRKVYAVYYDGSSTFSCGGGAWPPALVGNVAAMYLRGTPPGAPPCASNPIGASVNAPGYIEFGMIHEIFHTIGFVATCAPHHVLAGHTSDSTNDLMWAGNAPWILPARLDIGRDDYFQHGRPCLDASKSAFMTPSAPDATPPPGWLGVSVPSSTGADAFLCVLSPNPTEIRIKRD